MKMSKRQRYWAKFLGPHWTAKSVRACKATMGHAAAHDRIASTLLVLHHRRAFPRTYAEALRAAGVAECVRSTCEVRFCEDGKFRVIGVDLAEPKRRLSARVRKRRCQQYNDPRAGGFHVPNIFVNGFAQNAAVL